MKTIEKEIEIKNQLLDIFKSVGLTKYRVQYNPGDGSYDIFGEYFFQAEIEELILLCTMTGYNYYFRSEKGGKIILRIHDKE